MKTKILLFLLILLRIGGSAFGQTPNNARMLSTPNAQTGTTYTFAPADTTRITTFSNANPVAVGLPNGATFGFGAGTMLSVVNLGAGTVTITCSSCTINGAATLALSQNQGADIYGGAGNPAVNYIAVASYGNGVLDNILNGPSIYFKHSNLAGPLPVVWNANFEASTTLPIPDWDVNPHVISFTYDTVTPYEGNQSGKLVCDNNPSGCAVLGGEGEAAAAQPGDTYYVQGYVKSDGSGQACIWLAFLDKTGLVSGSPVAACSNSTSWTFVSASGTAPAGTMAIVIYLTEQPTGTAGTTEYDAISVYKTNHPGPETFTQQVNVGPGLGGIYNNCALQTGGGGGCLYISGPVSYQNNADPTVTLQNTDFENSLAIPPPGWWNFDNTTVSYETSTPAPNKHQSLKIVSTQSGGGLQSAQNFSVRPGDTYTLSAVVKSDGTHNANIFIVWVDKNNVYSTDKVATTTSASWTAVSINDTAPLNAVSMFIDLNSSTIGASAWFDEISVQRNNFQGGIITSNPVINGTPTGSGIPYVIPKTGSGSGNYTGTNTTFAAVDTGMCFLLSVPVGWKLTAQASGVLESITAAVTQSIALADAGTYCGGGGVTPLAGSERDLTPPAAGVFNTSFSTQAVIVGDGVVHSIVLIAKTSNASDAWGIQNTSAAAAPSLIYRLVPSN